MQCGSVCYNGTMIEQLFGSKTRVKLLQLFMKNPGRAFYVREITRKINEQINSVRRELANLLEIGIITSDTSNNRLYYEVNQKFEHYDALSALFTKAKLSAKVAAPVMEDEEYQKALGPVELILLTGSFTRDPRVNVDVVIIGNLSKVRVKKFINDMEKDEGRELTYATMTTDEFAYRRQVHDRFVSDVLAAKYVVQYDPHGLVK